MERYNKVRDKANILVWNGKKRSIVRGRIDQMIFIRKRDNLVREIIGGIRLKKISAI